MKAAITTHVLYLHNGLPACGLEVALYRPGQTTPLTSSLTDADGRIGHWGNEWTLQEGLWRLQFKADAWLAAAGQQSFYGDIDIAFKVHDLQRHYHVPLLLNAFGYSTYRGS